MIYELYGIPGAGKTTVINKVKGNNSVSYSRKTGIKGTLLSAAKIISAYLPAAMRYKRSIKMIIGKRKMTPVYTHASISHNINNIVMVAFGYKHLKRTMYMDEGIFHRIMTFAINYNIGIEDTLSITEVFSDCMVGVKSLYLKVPADECFKSIKRRNRHESEMDELDDKKLREFLSKYENYSEAIYARYGHTIITRENFEELKQC